MNMMEKADTIKEYRLFCLSKPQVVFLTETNFQLSSTNYCSFIPITFAEKLYKYDTVKQSQIKSV